MDERVAKFLQLANELLENPPKEVPPGRYPSDLEPVIKWLFSIVNKKVEVAYLGPPGSYTHQAALILFGRSELVEKKTISEVFESVVRGESAFGVVPIANKLEGPVNETIDNLFFHETGIVKAIEIPIRIVLGSGTVDRIDKIKRIYGHPMIFGQARRLLEQLKVPTVPTTSTSEAARIASEEEGAAALCSPLAAEMYSLKVLKDSVEDYPNNSTKFLVIARGSNLDGKYTAIIVSVPHRPGGLYEFLEPFAKNRVNLTMIYSRPMKGLPWSYIFYIEMEGSLEDLGEVIEKARGKSTIFKTLGSYDLLEVQR